jgi:hypothetical protein
MYTIISAVLGQQRKSDVMTSFGHSACSAVYLHKQVPHCQMLVEMKMDLVGINRPIVSVDEIFSLILCGFFLGGGGAA